MEYLDIIDEDGNPTGQIEERGKVHDQNLYHRVIQVFIVNSKNELLIQRRSASRKSHPNMWSISCEGHVPAGFSSIDGALKELSEELGLFFQKNDLTEMFTLKRRLTTSQGSVNHLIDVYLIKKDIDLDEIIIQKEEVSGVKWIAITEYQRKINRKNPDFKYYGQEEHDKLLEYFKDI